MGDLTIQPTGCEPPTPRASSNLDDQQPTPDSRQTARQQEQPLPPRPPHLRAPSALCAGLEPGGGRELQRVAAAAATRADASKLVIERVVLPFADDAAPDDPLPYRYTRSLLRTGEHYLVHTFGGPIQLVVQRGYLDQAAVRRLAADLDRARREIPAFVGSNARSVGRLTIYVSGESGPGTEGGVPMSNARAPSPFADEDAVILRFVADGRAPGFHELTHVFEPDTNRSESLSEGFADWVQQTMRPGKPVAFQPDNLDLAAEARRALRAHPEIEAAIGDDCFVRFGGDRRPEHGTVREIRNEQGALVARRRDYAADARHGYYYASHSFVRFLIDRHGLERFQSVYATGGRGDAYQRVYGTTLEELRQAWKQSLGPA